MNGPDRHSPNCNGAVLRRRARPFRSLSYILQIILVTVQLRTETAMVCRITGRTYMDLIRPTQVMQQATPTVINCPIFKNTAVEQILKTPILMEMVFLMVGK